MKTHNLFTIVGLAAAAHGQLFQGSSNGVVSMPFQRRSLPGQALRRRSLTSTEVDTGTPEYNIDSNVNVTIGTPPQIVGRSTSQSLNLPSVETIQIGNTNSMASKELTLDTGSYILVVQANQSGFSTWCMDTGNCTITTSCKWYSQTSCEANI